MPQSLACPGPRGPLPLFSVAPGSSTSPLRPSVSGCAKPVSREPWGPGNLAEPQDPGLRAPCTRAAGWLDAGPQPLPSCGPLTLIPKWKFRRGPPCLPSAVPQTPAPRGRKPQPCCAHSQDPSCVGPRGPGFKPRGVRFSGRPGTLERGSVDQVSLTDGPAMWPPVQSREHSQSVGI